MNLSICFDTDFRIKKSRSSLPFKVVVRSIDLKIPTVTLKLEHPV